MTLRVSLRSRELLGARPPIFPSVPVQCCKQEGFRLENGGFRGFLRLRNQCGIPGILHGIPATISPL